MTIKPLAAGDWEHFHALAAAEGWKISFTIAPVGSAIC